MSRSKFSNSQHLSQLKSLDYVTMFSSGENQSFSETLTQKGITRDITQLYRVPIPTADAGDCYCDTFPVTKYK